MLEVQDPRPGAATTRYTSTMHGERTKVEVFSRVPDYSFRKLELGSMALIAMRCGAVSIRREAEDVRERPHCMSTFIHQARGRGSFRHYGNQIALDEGDFTLCNNSAPYELNLFGPGELIMFRVPTPVVRETIPSHETHCGRLLRRDDSLASTAAAMLQDLGRKDLSRLAPEASERAGRHVLDVLASSYLAMPDQESSGSAVMMGRFWKVKLFIEEHLRNPELSPSFVARSLRISDRYLRMIFEVADETPSSYILRRRLEECAAQLRDPRWRQTSITEIAFGWGFNSAPHFARRFRARFLCSPRDYRSQLAA